MKFKVRWVNNRDVKQHIAVELQGLSEASPLNVFDMNKLA